MLGDVVVTLNPSTTGMSRRIRSADVVILPPQLQLPSRILQVHITLVARRHTARPGIAVTVRKFISKFPRVRLGIPHEFLDQAVGAPNVHPEAAAVAATAGARVRAVPRCVPAARECSSWAVGGLEAEVDDVAGEPGASADVLIDFAHGSRGIEIEDDDLVFLRSAQGLRKRCTEGRLPTVVLSLAVPLGLYEVPAMSVPFLTFDATRGVAIPLSHTLLSVRWEYRISPE